MRTPVRPSRRTRSTPCVSCSTTTSARTIRCCRPTAIRSWTTRTSSRRCALRVRRRVEQGACPRAKLLAPADVEVFAEVSLEDVELIVGVQALALCGEERLHHWIVAGRELDHERRAELREPVDELAERDVAGDRHMVDERERDHEVGPAPLEQRTPLAAAPAQTRRRIGDARRERQ